MLRPLSTTEVQPVYVIETTIRYRSTMDVSLMVIIIITAAKEEVRRCSSKIRSSFGTVVAEVTEVVHVDWCRVHMLLVRSNRVLIYVIVGVAVISI